MWLPLLIFLLLRSLSIMRNFCIWPRKRLCHCNLRISSRIFQSKLHFHEHSSAALSNMHRLKTVMMQPWKQCKWKIVEMSQPRSAYGSNTLVSYVTFPVICRHHGRCCHYDDWRWKERAKDRQHVSTHNTLRSFDILWTIRPEEKVQRMTLFAKLIPAN